MSCQNGDINDEDLKKVRSMVKESKTISLRKKKDYGLFY